MIVFLDPVPKPRMTMADRWRKRPCVLLYRSFCDELRASGATISPGFSLLFGIAMPQSWSKKKRLRMRGEPHQRTPDIDNLTKAVMDALLKDDSGIWKISSIEKRWSDTGFIIINNEGEE